MPTATYHHSDGSENVVTLNDGTSLMRAAITNDVNGIIGECGGQAMCATCHVYVRETFADLLDPVSEDEDEMLDCTVAPRQANSRLGCQIVMSPDLDGVEVDVPAAQV